MTAFNRIQRAASARIMASAGVIARSLGHIQDGRPLDAEEDPSRQVANVGNLLGVSLGTARSIIRGERPESLALSGTQQRRAEAILGDSVDWVPIAWLDLARRASNAVGRMVLNGRGIGTGFLISDRLLITNNHVIGRKEEARDFQVEFNYELDPAGQPREVARWSFDPEAFFITDSADDLDYTVVALGKRLVGRAELRDLGHCPLSADSAKHALGNQVTLVQHPSGDYKLIVFRENRLLHRGDNVLHYTADTEPGASGSPVFNDLFQVVALHHWGGPHRELTGPDGKPLNKDVNEGIRISAIVGELTQRRGELTTAQASLLDQAISGAATSPTGSSNATMQPATPSERPAAYPVMSPYMADRRAAVPAREGALRIDPDYDNRRGYNPRFLGRGHEVPLPVLSALQRRVAARPQGIGDGATSFALAYHHFSVVMNATRRLAFFTAVNIDGYSWRNVDRDTGLAQESAEAREVWSQDPRISPRAQCADELYLKKMTSQAYFQRGHLVRRLDPTWGAKDMAERANADTFHFTNCAPQSSGFNDSKSHWAGIEDYILFTTDTLRERVSVFTGPVLREDDPVWRDIQVPRAYFKIVARVQDDRLVATALLAEQNQFVDSILSRPARERFDNWDRIQEKLAEFQSSIAEIERLTGLDFGPLRAHDSFHAAGEGAEAVARRRLLVAEDLEIDPIERGMPVARER